MARRAVPRRAEGRHLGRAIPVPLAAGRAHNGEREKVRARVRGAHAPSAPRAAWRRARERGAAHVFFSTPNCARRSPAVKPVSDLDNYGSEEVWAYPEGRGDCEDYALEKKKRLSEAGLPPGNLLQVRIKTRGSSMMKINPQPVASSGECGESSKR